jgi:FeS assembly protein SufD
LQNLYDAWKTYQPAQEPLVSSAASLNKEEWDARARQWGEQDYPAGEDWKYVDFSSLRKKSFRLAQSDRPPEATEDEQFCTITLKDFSSPLDLIATGLPRGLKIYTHAQLLKEDLWRDQLIHKIQASGQPHTLGDVPTQFLGLGLFIQAQSPIKKALKIKVDLNQWPRSDSFMLAPLHLWVQVVPGAQLDLCIEYLGDDYSGLSLTHFNIEVQKNGRLNLYRCQGGGGDAYFMQSASVDVETQGHFNSFDFTLPSSWSRHDTKVQLLDKGAEATLKGVYINKDKDFSDHHSWIYHKKGLTNSNQDYRGLLTDSAHAVFNGKVIIEKHATQSNSQQINKNLMLSRAAEVDTKPELQIDNDDVKATHGATVGQIDKEQKFYLMSRGFSEEQAMKALCRAFIFDLIEGQADLVRAFYESSLLKSLDSIKES